jgi:hypothetical protein
VTKRYSFRSKNQIWEFLFSYVHYIILLFIYLFVVSSTCIIRMIKSMRMRWAGHVTRMGEKRNEYRILVGARKKGIT